MIYKGERALIFKYKVIEGGEGNLEGETLAMLNQMVDYIMKVPKELLGESKGRRRF